MKICEDNILFKSLVITNNIIFQNLFLNFVAKLIQCEYIFFAILVIMLITLIIYFIFILRNEGNCSWRSTKSKSATVKVKRPCGKRTENN